MSPPPIILCNRRPCQLGYTKSCHLSTGWHPECLSRALLGLLASLDILSMFLIIITPLAPASLPPPPVLANNNTEHYCPAHAPPTGWAPIIWITITVHSSEWTLALDNMGGIMLNLTAESKYRNYQRQTGFNCPKAETLDCKIFTLYYCNL